MASDVACKGHAADMMIGKAEREMDLKSGGHNERAWD